MVGATRLTPSHFLMVPVEENDQLKLKCRHCGNYIDSFSNFVYVENYDEAHEVAITSNVSADHTYPKIRVKTPCGHDEAVYYYSSKWNYNCSLMIYYCCLRCGRTWAKGGESFKKVEV